jgi:hypothetical protein
MTQYLKSHHGIEYAIDVEQNLSGLTVRDIRVLEIDLQDEEARYCHISTYNFVINHSIM